MTHFLVGGGGGGGGRGRTKNSNFLIFTFKVFTQGNSQFFIFYNFYIS